MCSWVYKYTPPVWACRTICSSIGSDAEISTGYLSKETANLNASLATLKRIRYMYASMHPCIYPEMASPAAMEVDVSLVGYRGNHEKRVRREGGGFWSWYTLLALYSVVLLLSFKQVKYGKSLGIDMEQHYKTIILVLL
jgi:hypothetical protein